MRQPDRCRAKIKNDQNGGKYMRINVHLFSLCFHKKDHSGRSPSCAWPFGWRVVLWFSPRANAGLSCSAAKVVYTFDGTKWKMRWYIRCKKLALAFCASFFYAIIVFVKPIPTALVIFFYCFASCKMLTFPCKSVSNYFSIVFM